MVLNSTLCIGIVRLYTVELIDTRERTRLDRPLSNEYVFSHDLTPNSPTRPDVDFCAESWTSNTQICYL
jgi:hypothetical protein